MVCCLSFGLLQIIIVVLIVYVVSSELVKEPCLQMEPC